MAVWPSSEVVDVLRALPRPPVPGLRWTTEDQWHVTLRFLGEAEVEEAAAALDALSWDGGPVEAVLGPRTERLGRTIVHVPVAGLDEVAAAAVAATAGVGEPPADRPFRGHLTLARAHRGRVDLRPLVGAAMAGRWPVEEVTLVAGRLHPQGARYEVVSRAPLVSPPGA